MEVKLQETHEIHSDELLLLQPRQIVIKFGKTRQEKSHDVSEFGMSGGKR